MAWSAYAEGIYVNSNFTTASEYFKKASELGHSYANIELGGYFFGTELKKMMKLQKIIIISSMLAVILME